MHTRAARSSRKSVVVLSGLTVVALAALSACGGSSDGDDSAKGASAVNVTMASGSNGDECTYDATTAAAGPVTFTIKNESATGVSEFELLSDQKIVGERENLAPGLASSTFTVTLGGGTYQMYCPGASNETTDLKVTGEAATESASSTQQLLQQGASDYAAYASDQIKSMITAVQVLKNAVDSGDVKAAQKAYAEARPFYERVESDVEGFTLEGFKPTDNHGNLDYLIDMRASNLDPAVGWHGFHAVERDIFAKGKITSSTKKLASELLINVV
jgi:iron uptake system component EfeO